MAKKTNMAHGTEPSSFNVAEAKQRLSELIGRVAYGGVTVVITRRGRPMAKLVPVDQPESSHLADVEGWLDEESPFFTAVDEQLAARSAHRPRVSTRQPRAGGTRGRS